MPHDSSLIEQPQEPAAAPYFTSWVTPQILKAVGPFRAYYGGLKIRTTIDLKLQQAAEQAVTEELPTGPGEPTASLVSIDNATGQVRAMVGGPLVDGHQDYERYPFNLATLGERQPGSSFKPFTLAVALQHGYTPDSVFDSKPLSLVVPNSGGKEIYHVHNDDNEYRGPITVAEATAQSDNSVFTQLGLSPGVGTKRISRMAQADGHRHAGLDQPRDDHRRAQGRRLTAGDGARLRDARHRRQPRLRPGARGHRTGARSGSRRSSARAPSATARRKLVGDRRI